MQYRFTMGNVKGAEPPRAGPDRGGEARDVVHEVVVGGVPARAIRAGKDVIWGTPRCTLYTRGEFVHNPFVYTKSPGVFAVASSCRADYFLGAQKSFLGARNPRAGLQIQVRTMYTVKGGVRAVIWTDIMQVFVLTGVGHQISESMSACSTTGVQPFQT
jgi:hypothetical protein